jgi:hypothetical protein
MGYFFLLLAGFAGFGLFKMARSSKKSRKYLQASREDQPLQIAHLSPGLRQLAQDTRFLRISLEAPVINLRDYIDGDLDATAEDLDAFDAMLLGVTRQLADWLATVDQLPEEDRHRMADLGADAAAVRNALGVEGWAFERRHLRMNGQPPMDRRLAAIVGELARIETRLQATGDIYR